MRYYSVIGLLLCCSIAHADLTSNEALRLKRLEDLVTKIDINLGYLVEKNQKYISQQNADRKEILDYNNCQSQCDKKYWFEGIYSDEVSRTDRELLWDCQKQCNKKLPKAALSPGC